MGIQHPIRHPTPGNSGHAYSYSWGIRSSEHPFGKGKIPNNSLTRSRDDILDTQASITEEHVDRKSEHPFFHREIGIPNHRLARNWTSINGSPELRQPFGQSRTPQHSPTRCEKLGINQWLSRIVVLNCVNRWLSRTASINGCPELCQSLAVPNCANHWLSRSVSIVGCPELRQSLAVRNCKRGLPFSPRVVGSLSSVVAVRLRHIPNPSNPRTYQPGL